MWLLLLVLLGATPAWAEDLGELIANPFNPESTSNPFGAGSLFKPDGLNNPFSNQSATNPYATDTPKLYDQQGQYRGKLSANPASLSSS
jgi:hypothetical protein